MFNPEIFVSGYKKKPFFAMHTFNQEPTKNYISDFLQNHLALQLSSPRCLTFGDSDNAQQYAASLIVLHII